MLKYARHTIISRFKDRCSTLSFCVKIQNMIRRNQPISHCVPSLYYTTTTTTTTTWSRIFKRGMGALQLICRFHLILFKWMFCHHLAIAVVYIHWKGKIRVRVEWQLGLLCYQCWQCCTDELTLPLHFIVIIQWQWIEGSKRIVLPGQARKLGSEPSCPPIEAGVHLARPSRLYKTPQRSVHSSSHVPSYLSRGRQPCHYHQPCHSFPQNQRGKLLLQIKWNHT